MGYMNYTLPDGRKAGYAIEATCDKTGCDAKIDRGLEYLCGEDPDGRRPASEPGCGKYHCPRHQDNHDCTNPECGANSQDGNSYCGRLLGHDLPHEDKYDQTMFTKTEHDEV